MGTETMIEERENPSAPGVAIVEVGPLGSSKNNYRVAFFPSGNVLVQFLSKRKNVSYWVNARSPSCRRYVNSNWNLAVKMAREKLSFGVGL